MHPLCSCGSYAVVSVCTTRIGDGMVLDVVDLCEAHARQRNVPGEFRQLTPVSEGVDAPSVLVVGGHVGGRS